VNNHKVVIAGIGGFVGRHLADYLRASDPAVEIVGLGRAVRAPAGDVRAVELLDFAAVKRCLAEIAPDCVFHLAGTLYSNDWGTLYANNVQTTINMIEAVQEVCPRARVIVPGSAAEYGAIAPADLPLSEGQPLNPISPYGVAKTWQTAAAKYYATSGADVIVARIFNIIGKGMPETLSIGAFAAQLRSIRARAMPPNISVGNLKPKRDFVDVRDVCAALAALSKSGERGETYNVCSGIPVAIEEVLHGLIARSGLQVGVSTDPARVKKADIDEIYGSNHKIRERTGWTPIFSLSDSISAMID
jgi:GDP-4-dehydro-6-deoxy-D-mannose reductase